MANSLTNFINFDSEDIKTANGIGLISTIDWDRKIIIEAFKSDNEKAPTHQVFALSPAGHKINIGAIWEQQSQSGSTYFSIQLPRMNNFRANLGKYAGQDDLSVQAIIPWDDK